MTSFTVQLLSAPVITTMGVMGRWEPGAAERLKDAALHLFAAHGYDATTVGDVAERAGVTERTFFRHFADKREVLFEGEREFHASFLDGIAAAPADASTIELMTAALEAGGSALQVTTRRDRSRIRKQVISVNEPLRERERLKLAKLAEVISEALGHRGVDRSQARLAGEAVVTVFTTAYETWISSEEDRDLVELQQEALGALRALLSGGTPLR
jgi:AcrR family transcriptional regulator